MLHIVSLGQQSCGYSGKVRWMDFNTPQQTNYEDCGSYATFCILNQLYKRSDFTEVDQLKAFGESDITQFRMAILHFIYYISGDEKYLLTNGNCLICLLPTDLSQCIIGYCELSRKSGVYHQKCLSVSTVCVCCHTKSEIIIYTPTSYFNLLEKSTLNESTIHHSVWCKRVLRTSIHICQATINPYVIGPIINEFVLVFNFLRKLGKKDGDKLISDADMVKITAHFKKILSLTSYRDHSRCKIVNSCANFLDLKMISVLKPLVYFGKKIVGSIKGETHTFFNCLLSYSQNAQNSTCFHECHAEDMKATPVIVEYLPQIRANEIKSVCDDVLAAVGMTSGSVRTSKRWREEDEVCNFHFKKHKIL